MLTWLNDDKHRIFYDGIPIDGCWLMSQRATSICSLILPQGSTDYAWWASTFSNDLHLGVFYKGFWARGKKYPIIKNVMPLKNRLGKKIPNKDRDTSNAYYLVGSWYYYFSLAYEILYDYQRVLGPHDIVEWSVIHPCPLPLSKSILREFPNRKTEKTDTGTCGRSQYLYQSLLSYIDPLNVWVSYW